MPKDRGKDDGWKVLAEAILLQPLWDLTLGDGVAEDTQAVTPPGQLMDDLFGVRLGVPVPIVWR